MWTRNRLRRPSDPAGLSNCLEIPVRHRFNLARWRSRVTIASCAGLTLSLAPNNPAIPTPRTSARVASTRSEGEDRPRSIWLRKPIDRSVRAATASSDMARVRLRSRIRCPTATSIAGSALAASLLNRLPPLTSNRFLHVHENLLHARRQCDHNFMKEKIGFDGETHTYPHVVDGMRRPLPKLVREYDAFQTSRSGCHHGSRPCCRRAQLGAA